MLGGIGGKEYAVMCGGDVVVNGHMKVNGPLANVYVGGDLRHFVKSLCKRRISSKCYLLDVDFIGLEYFSEHEV